LENLAFEAYKNHQSAAIRRGRGAFVNALGDLAY